MASVVIKVPGKTFIAGEYLALHGGPTLVVTNQPCFELRVKNFVSEIVQSQDEQTSMSQLGNSFLWNFSAQVLGIHEMSPAGKLISEYQEKFQNCQIEFDDPYLGLGGLGASTAQFLSVYAFVFGQIFSADDLLKAYRKYAWSGEGLPPSGADLLAQWRGGVQFPFYDLSFFVVRTGKKLATHEHLDRLSDFSDIELRQAMQKILKSYEGDVNASEFIAGINQYATALEHLNFVAPYTKSMLAELRLNTEILAAKGCGAMGADLCFVVFSRNNKQSVRNYLLSKNFDIAFSEEEIVTTGINSYAN